MLSFPITHISKDGPNKEGGVLFLESVSLDYAKVDERKRALERDPKYSGYQIVIFRTSRRPRGKNGKFRLNRERPSASQCVSNERDRDSAPVNYVFYAISKTTTTAERSDEQLLQEACDICNHHGQQGDPTTGGNR